MIASLWLVLAASLLAVANGANDNFKGVASLYGSGLTSYRTALAWASITTAAGSLASLFLASALLQKFTGKGLVPEALVTSEAFIFSVATGASATVLLASRLGLPISTTHGLLGALTGAGLAAVGPAAINFAALATGFALPLILGPLLAMCLGAIIFSLSRVLLRRTTDCLCIDADMAPRIGGINALVTTQTSLSLHAGSATDCEDDGRGRLARFKPYDMAGALHWFSAGAVSFARGLNDTPKIAALLLAAPIISTAWSIALVASLILIGGVMGARRVAETMSQRITKLDAQEGVSANLATSALVMAASLYGLPVSTTHVSVGAIFGIAMSTRQGNMKTISGIVMSWLITLPVAAALSGSVYFLFSNRIQ